jgi:uncharacterized protein HemY
MYDGQFKKASKFVHKAEANGAQSCFTEMIANHMNQETEEDLQRDYWTNWSRPGQQVNNSLTARR